MIRVVLPHHLRNLAATGREVDLDVPERATLTAAIDALERDYPGLRGTLRDPASGRRRAFVRFFALDEDLSHEDPDSPLPPPVADGREPFRIIGAMAGG
ncbi:MAG TPA: MoaD/ThiS family protein [Acidimicrobiales bacterium]|nr:MoaD/ThiS family protein [Acidimicrobiales bacterium]